MQNICEKNGKFCQKIPKKKDFIKKLQQALQISFKGSRKIGRFPQKIAPPPKKRGGGQMSLKNLEKWQVSLKHHDKMAFYIITS